MAKGKKGKGGKEAKQEDPEKLAELRRQQQIIAKAELRRRVEEESANTKINNLKIINQWRKIMRLAKTEALKKDIEILSQNHERDVDRKDAILQMLDRDLEEAEDQYQMSLRSHLNNVDELIKLHDSRLFSLERSFQKELKQLQGDFDKEKASMVAKFKKEKKALQSIVDAIEKEEEDRENESKHLFEQLREEIRNRNLEDINMLRISLDAQIEELEAQFETAHLNYLQHTAQRTHDFKELTQNDQRLSLDIDQRRKKIDVLQITIQHWRAKIRQLTREAEERNRLLRDEKNSIQHHYQQLKQRVQAYRGSQTQRLLHLSQAANHCKDVLKEKLDLARRILQSAEMSRKVETLYEQVLPFVPVDLEANPEGSIISAPKTTETSFSSAVAESEEALVPNPNRSLLAKRDRLITAPPSAAHQSCVIGTDGVFVPYSDRLANFHRRFNKVLVDNIAIAKEKDRLLLENSQLENLIQQYIDGTRVTDNTLNEDNPLFVVNGRANLNHVPPVRIQPPTIQDCVTIQYTTNKQMA